MGKAPKILQLREELIAVTVSMPRKQRKAATGRRYGGVAAMSRRPIEFDEPRRDVRDRQAVVRTTWRSAGSGQISWLSHSVWRFVQFVRG